MLDNERRSELSKRLFRAGCAVIFDPSKNTCCARSLESLAAKGTRTDYLSTEKAPCMSAAEPAENAKKRLPVAICRDSRLDWLSLDCLSFLSIVSVDAIMSTLYDIMDKGYQWTSQLQVPYSSTMLRGDKLR